MLATCQSHTHSDAEARGRVARNHVDAVIGLDPDGADGLFCPPSRAPLSGGCRPASQTRDQAMAKTNTVQIKLISTADTGFFYVTKKNARTTTTKLELNKYDPVVRKHVPFKEAKIK